MLWVLLFLLQARVVATPLPQCDEDKYAFGRLCCNLCPPGQHVSAHCDENQATQCSPCQPGTFMDHKNHDTQCQICAPCDDTQELVKDCTPISDRQCQCKTGSYYCDTEHCAENCYPCTRCPGDILQACNATHDTVCATEPSPKPGDGTRNPLSTDWRLFWGLFCGSLVILIFVIGFITYRRRVQRRRGFPGTIAGQPQDSAAGVQLCQKVFHLIKHKSSEPGSHVHSREGVQPNEDPGSGPPAPDVETAPLMGEEDSALAPGARRCPGPSEDPGEGMAPTVVSRGSQTAPELAPDTVPDAQGLQTRASISLLRQEYKRKYFLKDVPYDAIKKLCEKFSHTLPEDDQTVFTVVPNTEERDTEVSDHENQGTLAEPHRNIADCCKKEPRWDIFLLMAALRYKGSEDSLQNFINMLIAEDIIGSYAETPN